MSNTARITIPPSIGIDLGTTYSCVGVWKDGHVEIVANEQGNRTTPSIVAFTESHRLIGESAKAQITTNPENTVFDAKRLIGRYYHDHTVQNDLKHWPFKIVADESKKIKIEVKYKGQIRRFYPEISSMVLGKMKNIAETYLGQKIENAVITVPAYFNDAQRQATKDAGTIAGLHVMRIINEPTAAAIAYGLDKTGKGRRNVLIFDLGIYPLVPGSIPIGGGTFDVSLLAIENGVFEVLATNGDTHLGGEDFDNKLVDYCINEFKRRYHRDMSKVQTSIRRLRSACERAKRLLSSEPQAYINIDSLYDGIDFSITISRAKFEDLNLNLFHECIKPVKNVLKDGKVDINHVHDVVLVGGSTRIPKVQEILRDFFHGKELCKSVNQDEAVAYGATVQASILSGYRIDNKTSLLLLDVVPLSLGVEVAGGRMEKIIPKNSTVPICKTRIFTTNMDNQEEVEIQVFEGEKSNTRNNNKLASFILTHIPPAPKGIPRIEVKFDIDSNGILTVSASESSSGQKAEIQVVNDKNHLTSEMIQKMVQESNEFDEMDSKAVARRSAKADLNNYLHHISQQLKIDIVKKQLTDEQMDDILNKLDEYVDWLDDHPDASVEDFNTKQLEFEYYVEPLLASLVLQSFSHKDPIRTEENIPMENIDS